jgi:hypothetical protein
MWYFLFLLLHKGLLSILDFLEMTSMHLKKFEAFLSVTSVTIITKPEHCKKELFH